MCPELEDKSPRFLIVKGVAVISDALDFLRKSPELPPVTRIRYMSPKIILSSAAVVKFTLPVNSAFADTVNVLALIVVLE